MIIFFAMFFFIYPISIFHAETHVSASTYYAIGDKSKSVQSMKQDLIKAGFGLWENPTTYFGSSTERAVKRFQSYYSLSQDGMMGPESLQKLNEVINSPYQKGKRSLEIQELKMDLLIIGFATWENPTTYYGPETESVVKEFQRRNGLTVNGIMDDVTLDKVQSLKATKPMKKGQRNSAILKFKKQLVKLGFATWGNPTTYFGSSTERAVKEFQSYFGLTSDGAMDYESQSTLKAAANTSYQKGKSSQDIQKIKKDLVFLGYASWSNPTTYYGSDTEKVVKSFQSNHNLRVNGIIDNITLNKIISLKNSPLKYGLSRPDVLEFKRELVKLGFASWENPTTYFGSSTLAAVENFQKYYNLDVDGMMGPHSLQTLEEAVNSSYQKGNSSQSIQDIKLKLKAIGFGTHWGTPTTYFGPDTERVVKEFQKEYGLVENGIIEQRTLSKIEELSGPKETDTHYDATLDDALNIQMNQLQQTDKYRNDPAYISATYVDIKEHGVLDSTGNVNLRTSPSLKSNDNISTSGKNGDKITILEEVKGDTHEGSTKWYKINHKNGGETLYVHSSLVNPNGMVATTTANVNVRADTNTNSHIYDLLPKGKEVNIISKGTNWHQISYGAWRNPTRADVQSYLEPTKNDKYQHLVLSSTVKVPASELNKVLQGKGILDGLGQAFINGGEKHKVNEIYLISHALLESGNGTSSLAKGIEVGLNKDGNPTLVTTSNKSNLTKIKKVYNMFGIGAADSDPKRLGAIRAYNEGWTSPEAAVEGGAKFIGEQYINSSYKQDTLYKMRWNPGDPGVHQYATDIAWAVKQVETIKNLYEQINGASLHFDIPKYK